MEYSPTQLDTCTIDKAHNCFIVNSRRVDQKKIGCHGILLNFSAATILVATFGGDILKILFYKVSNHVKLKYNLNKVVQIIMLQNHAFLQTIMCFKFTEHLS